MLTAVHSRPARRFLALCTCSVLAASFLPTAGPSLDLAAPELIAAAPVRAAVSGDWDGDGIDSVGVVTDGRSWKLYGDPGQADATTTFTFGRAGDRPVTGDWDGDGDDTPGLRRGNRWYLTNRRTARTAEIEFSFGKTTDASVAGDWDDDGDDTPGVKRGPTWFLTKTLGGPVASQFTYGHSTDLADAGDPDGDGRDTPALRRGDDWYLALSAKTGTASTLVDLVGNGHPHALGDWDGDGRDTPSVWTIPLGAPIPTTCPGGPPGSPPGVEAQVVAPAHLDQQLDLGGDRHHLQAAMADAARYLLNDRSDATTVIPPGVRYLDLIDAATVKAENELRTPAMAAYAIAVALRTDAYDPIATGRSRANAIAHVRLLVRSVACEHRANTAGGWPRSGQQSQAAFWAYLAGTAGWLVWDSLPANERALVAAMIESEADRVLDVPVKYWMRSDRSIATPGDSKAEEVSWDANLLQLATAMFPSHLHVDWWRHADVQRVLAATAVPDDIASSEVVNGRALSVWLDGANAHGDGTIDNHGNRGHPDYQASLHQVGVGPLLGALADQDGAEAHRHNLDLVYDALQDVVFPAGDQWSLDPGASGPLAPAFSEPGGTIYRSSSNAVYYPNPSIWGKVGRGRFVAFDAVVATLADGAVAADARAWQTLHIGGVRTNQLRFTTGQTYKDRGEFRHAAREEFEAQQLAVAWLAIYVDEVAPVSWTTADLWSPPPP